MKPMAFWDDTSSVLTMEFAVGMNIIELGAQTWSPIAWEELERI